MRKLFLVFCAIFLFCMAFFSSANAGECVLFKDGKKSGVLKKMLISDGNVYLQSREAAKRIGGKIDFLAASGKAVFKTKKMQAVFEEGYDNVITNGEVSSFAKPVIIKSGVPYFLSDYFASDIFSKEFGAKIEFDCGGIRIPSVTAAASPKIVRQSETEDENKDERKTEITGMLYGSHSGYSRIVLELSSPIDPNNIEQVGYAGNAYVLQIKGVFSTVKGINGKLGKEATGAELNEMKDTAELKINLSEYAGRVEWDQLDKDDKSKRPYRLKIDIFALEPGETREEIIKAESESFEEISYEEQNAQLKAIAQAEENEQLAAEEAADADYSKVKVLISDAQKEGKKVIIIDAGHGGRDAGTFFNVKQKIGTNAVVVYKSKGKKPIIYYKRESCIKKHKKNGCVKSKILENKYKTVAVIKEKDITLEQSVELKKLFEKDKRFKVIMTRESDIELCENPEAKTNKQCKSEDLRRRNEIALENNADVFVSMHINSAGKKHIKPDGSCPTVSGFEILYRSKKKDALKGVDPIAMLQDLDRMDKAIEESSALAQSIDLELGKSAGQTNIKRLKNPYPDIQSGKTDFILRSARFPAVIVESGYLCNEKDRKMLLDEKVQKKITSAVYQGVINYGKQKNWPNF